MRAVGRAHHPLHRRGVTRIAPPAAVTQPRTSRRPRLHARNSVDRSDAGLVRAGQYARERRVVVSDSACGGVGTAGACESDERAAAWQRAEGARLAIREAAEARTVRDGCYVGTCELCGTGMHAAVALAVPDVEDRQLARVCACSVRSLHT